jgi:lysophospholipase L1-like esterase
MIRRHLVLVIVAAIALIALVACSTGSRAAKGPAAAPSTGPAMSVLALGGSATEGDGVPDRLRDAWPYLVFQTAFPRSTIFVNGALDDATLQHAITAQAPLAAQLKPDVVEVWLGADDVTARTPISVFRFEFHQLLDLLHASGARRILVADLPPALGNAASYNAAIHTEVAAAHAELVSLANTAITLEPTEGLTPQPDAASHRLIAAAFERRIAQAR